MELHSYQRTARNHLLDSIALRQGAGLWLDPGLGKTGISLKTVECLRAVDGVRKTLIVAPLRVILTSWPNEIAKWGCDLRYEIIQGPKRAAALARDADIYLMNVDNVRWLEKLSGWDFDLLIVDEVTKFKNWSAQCTKSLRRMLPKIPRRITLTGTPVPNSLADIFPQQFVLDQGKTLGTTIGRFREQWCRSCGYEGRQWEVVPSLTQPLLDLISPYYLRQEAVDHLDMPAVLRNEILVDLPPKAKQLYDKIHREMVAEFEDETVSALTPGSKYNLCRQIASGNFYGEDGEAVNVHSAKLDALADLIDELNGKPLLIGYCFRHEQIALAKRFKGMSFVNGSTSAQESVKILTAFSQGKLPLLAAQCQAMSHGVDGLQKHCADVCWLSPTDQPEIRQQFEARIYRQGVGCKNVRFHYILADKTVDLKIKRVLDRKDSVQRDVLRSIKCN
jgi:superfamily II DNA or RNA helicase